MRRWCSECHLSRHVEDDSMESAPTGVNFSEEEYHVVTLSCGHELVSKTGKHWPRPDGLEI